MAETAPLTRKLPKVENFELDHHMKYTSLGHTKRLTPIISASFNDGLSISKSSNELWNLQIRISVVFVEIYEEKKLKRNLRKDGQRWQRLQWNAISKNLKTLMHFCFLLT